MFYKEDYAPICYERLHHKLDHWPYDPAWLPGKVTDFHNFWIAEGEACTAK